MIDLIDTLDDPNLAPQYLFNEQILKEAIKLVESNIFRTFSNKSNKLYYRTLYSKQKDFFSGPR